MSEMNHPVVSREEWLEARKRHLEQEKELTRQRDALSRARRELPWVRVEKSYVFDGPGGSETLAELFDGRSQLLVYHFMMGPDWDEGCPSCSYLADQFDGIRIHLAQRDITLVAVSRTSVERLERYRERMGWHFKWVSSLGNDFNRDYHVSFTPEEMEKGEMTYNFHRTSFPQSEGPGVSVFRLVDGEVFHTYSTYARGLDTLIAAYHFMDLAPKGRDEDDLPWPMAWIRRHDSYEA